MAGGGSKGVLLKSLDGLLGELGEAQETVDVWSEAEDRPEFLAVRDQLNAVTNAISECRAHISAYKASESTADPRDAGASSAVGEREAALAQRERMIEEATASLETTRARLELDRQEFEQARFNYEQERLEGQMMRGGGGEADQLREMLRDVRQQLRDTEEVASAKSRLLEKRGVELNSLREQVELMQQENSQLEGDVRQITRQAAKKTEQAKEMVTRLQQDLQTSRQREAKAQEMLEAEHRKQRVLQLALQKELSARGSRSDADSDGSSDRMPAIARTSQSGRESVDVGRTLQRNQSLINELTHRRFENERLRSDNASLILHVKDTKTDTHQLKNAVVASQVDRAELITRLRRAEADAKRWQDQLSKVSLHTVRRHREERAAKIEREWDRIDDVRFDPPRPQSRMSSGRVSLSRNTQVLKWNTMNQPELL